MDFVVSYVVSMHFFIHFYFSFLHVSVLPVANQFLPVTLCWLACKYTVTIYLFCWVVVVFT